MRMITTDQLAQKMAFAAQLTEQQAHAAMQAMGSTVLIEIEKGHAVELQGFGLFELGTRGDGIRAVRFRQHNNVKEALNP